MSLLHLLEFDVRPDVCHSTLRQGREIASRECSLGRMIIHAVYFITYKMAA